MATRKKKELNSTRIEKRGGEFYVFVDGRFYGWTNDRATADRMRDQKRPADTAVEEVSELALWTLWNDASQNCGATVLADTNGDGFQFLSLPGGFWLASQPTGSGWDVEIWTEALFFNNCADHEDGTLDLVFAEKPYVLE